MLLSLLVTCAFLGLNAGIPGGLTPGDVHDENVQKIADFAVDKLDEMSNSMYQSKMTRLVSVKTQVSGELDRLRVLLLLVLVLLLLVSVMSNNSNCPRSVDVP